MFASILPPLLCQWLDVVDKPKYSGSGSLVDDNIERCVAIMETLLNFLYWLIPLDYQLGLRDS